VFGLADKGRIAEGFDADFTIVDMKAKRTITHDWMATRSGWTPFDGFEAKAWPMATIVRGIVVMRDDEWWPKGGGAGAVPGDPLARWASQAPHRVWLASGGMGEGWRTITYARRPTQVKALAGGLASLGLSRGQAPADPGPQRDRPRPDHLRRHEPGRADRAGLAAVRAEGRGPDAPGLRGRTAEAGRSMSTTPRRSPTPWPRRSWPACRWSPAATRGLATSPSRICWLRRDAARLPARRRRQAAADLGLDRAAQGGGLHPRQHRPERRPDRRLLRGSRSAGAGQFRALEPQPGGQRHPAHGAAPGRDVVH
jgi:hypothetical protein